MVTDMCLADALEPVSLPEIVATANEARREADAAIRARYARETENRREAVRRSRPPTAGEVEDMIRAEVKS